MVWELITTGYALGEMADVKSSKKKKKYVDKIDKKKISIPRNTIVKKINYDFNLGGYKVNIEFKSKKKDLLNKLKASWTFREVKVPKNTIKVKFQKPNILLLTKRINK